MYKCIQINILKLFLGLIYRFLLNSKKLLKYLPIKSNTYGLPTKAATLVFIATYLVLTKLRSYSCNNKRYFYLIYIL